jgi:hypothetical protein
VDGEAAVTDQYQSRTARRAGQVARRTRVAEPLPLTEGTLGAYAALAVAVALVLWLAWHSQAVFTL